MSNAAWPVKQKELNKGSKLLLNAYLIEEYPQVFDECAIDQRGQAFADIVLKTWPGPTDPSWGGYDLDRAGSLAVDEPLAERELVADSQEEASVPAEAREIRAAVVKRLAAGMTPDQIYQDLGRTQAIWVMAIEEEARLAGALGSVDPTPDSVASLRDDGKLRWERIAARVFGDASRTREVREMYDAKRGVGASKRSYTGRGRRFPGMA